MPKSFYSHLDVYQPSLLLEEFPALMPGQRQQDSSAGEVSKQSVVCPHGCLVCFCLACTQVQRSLDDWIPGGFPEESYGGKKGPYPPTHQSWRGRLRGLAESKGGPVQCLLCDHFMFELPLGLGEGGEALCPDPPTQKGSQKRP